MLNIFNFNAFLVYIVTEDVVDVVASFKHSCIAQKMNVRSGYSKTSIILHFNVSCHLTFNFSDPESLI